MNQENIDIAISKYLSGNSSPEEAISLEEWIAQSIANKEYFEEAYQLFHAQKLENYDFIKAWKKIEPKLIGGKKISLQTYWIGLAAAVLLFSITTFLYRLIQNKPSKEIYTYQTEDFGSEIILMDSSEINLQAHSQLTKDKGFGINNQLLYLKGSAYFNVKKHGELPLTIQTGNLFIRDIGTKFLIKSSKNEDTVFVKVDEGIVFVFDSLGSSKELKAGEEIRYLKLSKKFMSTTQTDTLHQSFNFVNQKLSEVLLLLKAAYNVPISLENEGLGNCRITAKFEKEELETVLLVICETLEIKFETSINGYHLKGNTCK